MATARTVSRVASLIVTCLALAGCVEAVGGLPSAGSTGSTPPMVSTDRAGNFVKSPDLAATPIHVAVPSCWQVDVTATAMPWTAASLMRQSEAIVLGTLEGYGEPRWDTPDGSRPTGRYIDAIMVRPVEITPERVIRGDARSVRHAITRGGQIGCDVVRFWDVEVGLRGSRYVFFLVPINDSSEHLSSDLLVLRAWPIGSDDMVRTEMEGRVPLSRIEELAAEFTMRPLPS